MCFRRYFAVGFDNPFQYFFYELLGMETNAAMQFIIGRKNANNDLVIFIRIFLPERINFHFVVFPWYQIIFYLWNISDTGKKFYHG